MFTRALLVLLVLAAHASASPRVEIHASVAAQLACDPVHLVTLRNELVQVLHGMPAARGLKLDVSIVRLKATTTGNTLVVDVEVRALLSDKTGRARFATSTRTTVTGSVKNRALIEGDAVKAATRQLGKVVRTQRCT